MKIGASNKQADGKSRSLARKALATSSHMKMASDQAHDWDQQKQQPPARAPGDFCSRM